MRLLAQTHFFVEIEGFEPSLTEPESVVLPLHHISILGLQRYYSFDNLQISWAFFLTFAYMNKPEKPAWFAASMRNKQWKKISLLLDDLGIGHYIPPSYNTLLFMRTVKSRALSLVNAGRLNARFFIDHSTCTLLEVPDKQMEDFIKVMENVPDAECTQEYNLAKGDKVVVTSGPLSGVEGEIVEVDGGTSLIVRVRSLLCAKVTISRQIVRPSTK